jgi:adenylylsulfate kinase-like enzyme
VRRARRQGPLREGVQGEIKEFTGVSTLRGAVEPELVVDTEAHEPEESAALVLAKLEELGLVRARCGVTRRRHRVS